MKYLEAFDFTSMVQQLNYQSGGIVDIHTVLVSSTFVDKDITYLISKEHKNANLDKIYFTYIRDEIPPLAFLKWIEVS